MNRLVLLAAALALACPVQVFAADHQVKMLNRGSKGSMVFEPDFVRAEVGDTVTFIPADKGHDAVSIKDFIPEGATPFRGKFNAKVTVTLDREGLYGVKCTPHYVQGMVALIAVGDPVNLAEVRAIRHPGRAGKVFERLLDDATTAQ